MRVEKEKQMEAIANLANEFANANRDENVVFMVLANKETQEGLTAGTPVGITIELVMAMEEKPHVAEIVLAAVEVYNSVSRPLNDSKTLKNEYLSRKATEA